MRARGLAPAWRSLGICLAGVLVFWALGADGAIRTVPKGQGRGSEAVRRALQRTTKAGRVEGLLLVLTGDELAAALEAVEVLAGMGSEVVPRLVSEMRRTRNNWLIGSTLVRMGAEAVTPVIELLPEADERTAVDCIYLLGEIQDRRAVPTLIRHLDDGRPQVRMYAVTALLQIGGTRAVEAVLTRLPHEGKGLESFIIEALLRYGRKSVEPILQNLLSEDPRVRGEVAFLLGAMGDPRAVEPLVRNLGDPDPVVRRNVAFALGELSGVVAERGPVVRALAASLGDPSAEVRERARGAMVRYGEAAVPTLVGVCRQGSTEEVTAALNALREIGSPKAESVMIDLLGHRSRQVRVAAVAGLITAGTGRSVEPLLNALRDEDLRWFAALALEKLGPENPQLFFAARPNDPTMSLRIQILVRLGRSVVPFLLQHLNDEHLGRRAAVVWILGEIGDAEAAPYLARMLTDPELSSLAVRSLRKTGEAGLKELVRYVQSPPSDEGALAAVEALALFDDPRAWDAIEAALSGRVPRVARVRCAVLLCAQGEAERMERMHAYLDGEGRHLWPEIRAALQAEYPVH